MRTASGKGNNARKVLSYYSVNFRISAPYQVLCDGPTIFQSFKKDIFLKHALPMLLGGTAYPVVTNCIVSELRSLGEDCSNAALFAKRATRVPCAHDGVVAASECILARISKPFEKKLMVATNDAGLLAQVGATPGVPIITIANQTKLVLKSPSKETLQHVQQHEAVKSSSLSLQDRAILEKLRAENSSANVGANVTRKRKRAKGPNPLSVKKQKTTIAKKGMPEPNPEMHHSKENRAVVPCVATVKGPELAATLGERPTVNEKEHIGDHTGRDEEEDATLSIQKSKRKRRRKKPIRQGEATPAGTLESDSKQHARELNKSQQSIPASISSRIDTDLKDHRPSSNAHEEVQGSGPENVEKQARAIAKVEAQSALTAAELPEEPAIREKPVEKSFESAKSSMSDSAMEEKPAVGYESLPELDAITKAPDAEVEAATSDGVENDATTTQAALLTKKKQRKNRRRRSKKN